MEADAIQQIPAIIEQAAKSPLGVFALMVIALSVLGFVFFRGAAERTRIAMFVLLFIGVASFGVAAMRVTPGEAVAPAAVAADIDGEWQAQVEYDWGDTHTEKFVFGYDGAEVLGTASYLGRKRALFDGRLDGDRIRFIVRSQEIAGGDSPSRELVHHYSGKVGENSIHFTLRTEGGVTGHIPIEFTAVRIR